MSAIETLQHLIDERQGRLAEGIPPDCEAALLALVRHIDAIPDTGEEAGSPDLITGRAVPALGAMRAVRLVLEADECQSGPTPDVDRWAEDVLVACRELESAAIVLHHVETGAMRLDGPKDEVLHAWLIGGRAPMMWRERAAIDDLDRLVAAQCPAGGDSGTVADALVAKMSHQLPYPADVLLGGLSVAAYRAVLAALIELTEGAEGPPALPYEIDLQDLVESVARARGLDAVQVERALSAMTIDRSSAGWHADTLAGPLPPLVHLADGRQAWSRHALLFEPLLFVARELRRRDPDDYHTTARHRETTLRGDIAALFPGARYLTSSAPIMLRTKDRQNRTDIDAAVFDRKTGTLGLFELKSQDPFARSAAERARQLETMRQAGAQMAAVLRWIDRAGADDILSRMDGPTAKRFRVQRVLPFVLGRYLADSGEENRRDRRIAWGTWPEVLRAIRGSTSGNPLLSLHTALAKGPGMSLEPWEKLSSKSIRLGAVELRVHASAEAARQARTVGK